MVLPLTTAVRAAARDYARLRELGALLSVGPADLAGRVAGLVEDKKANAKRIKSLEREVAQKGTGISS